MLEKLAAVRITALPEALDVVDTGDLIGLRLSADELLQLGEEPPAVDDPHAIVEHDVAMLLHRMDEQEARALMRIHAAWPPPPPGIVGQGSLAGLPVKVWLDGPDSFILVPRPYEADYRERVMS